MEEKEIMNDEPIRREPKGIAQPTAEEKLNYLKAAISQRKEAILSASRETTNPLDRLTLREKIEELDLVLNFLGDK